MSIHIQLETGEAYEPGSEVRGRVSWQSLGRPPNSVPISLLWHTEGKGTEDVEIIEQERLETPAATGDHAFAFRLPDFPWSFSGTLISLVWAIEASLDPGGEVSRVNIVCAPGAEEVRL
ncbi:MAG: hypothetical protein AAF560_33105 [Acidobacteriota bacterium]